MQEGNLIWYLQGAIVGILITAVFHVIVLSRLEVPVSSKKIMKCLETGGEITKVKVGGNVTCKLKS